MKCRALTLTRLMTKAQTRADDMKKSFYFTSVVCVPAVSYVIYTGIDAPLWIPLLITLSTSIHYSDAKANVEDIEEQLSTLCCECRHKDKFI